MSERIKVRELAREEASQLGNLMVEVYRQLEGFPSPTEQPDYYTKLANIGTLANQHRTKILVAVNANNELLGGIVYFGQMANYGSGGKATTLTDASGIRLLAVRSTARGMGVGKALTNACIQLARQSGHSLVVLHTTQAMNVAWAMYESLGFARCEDLDFYQQELPVFGFKLTL